MYTPSAALNSPLASSSRPRLKASVARCAREARPPSAAARPMASTARCSRDMAVDTSPDLGGRTEGGPQRGQLYGMLLRASSRKIHGKDKSAKAAAWTGKRQV